MEASGGKAAEASLPGATVSILQVQLEDYGRVEIRGEVLILSRMGALPPKP